MRGAGPPSCPRCGYDQSGVIATWPGASPPACPLSGRCSECGLEFLWGEVLNPRLAGPPWSFEHKGHMWARRLLASIRMCFRPRRLWAELRLEHPVNLRRAAVVALLGMLLTYGALAAFDMGLWAALARAFPVKRTWVGGVFTSSPFAGMLQNYGGWRTSLWPYGMRWGGPLSELMDPWVAHALLTVALMPLGFLALPVTLRRAKVRARHLTRAWLYSLPLVPLVVYAWVAAHVGRDALASVWRPPYWSGFPGSLVYTEAVRALLLPVLIVFLWRWWTAAVGRYMRIERARSVVLAMLTIALLAAGAVVLAVPAWNRDALAGWGF